MAWSDWSPLRHAVEAIQSAAATGRPGDGKVFTSRVEDALTILAGTRGPDGIV